MHNQSSTVESSEQPVSKLEAATLLASSMAASLKHMLEPYQAATGIRTGMLISRCYLCSALAYVLPSTIISGSALTLQCRADNPSAKYLAQLAASLNNSSVGSANALLEATATRIASSHSTVALEALAAARLYPCAKCASNYTLIGRSCAKCSVGSASATDTPITKSKRYVKQHSLNPLAVPLASEQYLLPATYRVLNNGDSLPASTATRSRSSSSYLYYRLATVTIAEPSNPYVAACGTANLWRMIYMLDDITATINSDTLVASTIVVYPCHIDTCRASLPSTL